MMLTCPQKHNCERFSHFEVDFETFLSLQPLHQQILLLVRPLVKRPSSLHHKYGVWMTEVLLNSSSHPIPSISEIPFRPNVGGAAVVNEVSVAT